LGLSSNDLVGHGFGPHSQEVLDITLRTDQLLAELLEYLDDRVGKHRWTLIVTSDHGIAPVPEYLERQGVLPERSDHYRRSNTAFRTAVTHALAQRFFRSAQPPAAFRNVIEAWVQPFVYVNPAAGAALPKPLAFDDLLEAVRDETRKLDGVHRVYVRRERMGLATSGDPIDRRAYRSWHAENGGDLLVVMEPYWLDAETMATTHGSPYRYDTHVPMIWYGAGVRAGRYSRPVEVADVAPTLAQLLGVTSPPMSQGRPLREALQD
jgi:arylsulfatase A-like enzyme